MTLLNAFDRLQHPRLLVMGDLILDRYTRGGTERVSQEAPVLILKSRDQEDRLGGAANVAQMLLTLGANVACAGVVGNDQPGQIIRESLDRLNIEQRLVLDDADRVTTLKERFLGLAGTGNASQLLRVDTEDTRLLPNELEQMLIDAIGAALSSFDAVLISDYAKGVCTPRLLQAVIALARQHGVPVLVDPGRGRDISLYHGATLLKPNRLEAAAATRQPVHSPDDALRIGRVLCRRLDLQLVVITLDSKGMALVTNSGQERVFSTRARSVYDITGAGDMAFSTLGMALASGVDPADAVQLANVAAGLEVDRTGVVPIRGDEIRAELVRNATGHRVGHLSIAEAAALADEYRRRGLKIGFTNGCFDLLHVGHVTYLLEAAELADVLFVGLNSDDSVRRLKGSGRPIIGQDDRAAILSALECVDHVVVFDAQTPHALLEAIRPDVLVKGGTYTPQEVVGREIVEAYGGQVCVTGMTDGVSTSEIVRSVQKRPQRKAG